MVVPFNLFLLTGEIVLNMILSKLTLKDISKLEQGLNNKHSHEEFRQCLKFFRLSYTVSSTTCQSLLKWMAERQIKVKMLYIGDDVNDDCLANFAEHNIQVEEFRQSGGVHLSVNSSLNILHKLSGLRSIFLLIRGPAGGVAIWNSVLEAHPSLRSFTMLYLGDDEFEITPQMISTITINCKQINNIHLNYCLNIDDSSVVLLAQQCRQLEELDLNGCLELTDISLKALGKHCPRLRVLDLKSARHGHVSDTGLVFLLQHCRQLTALHLWDCTGVTARSFTALVPLCGQITDLSLRNCSAFNSPEVEFAMKLLHRLTNISLENCTNISEVLLITLIRNNANLCTVDLSGVSNVTDNVMIAIGQTCSELWWLQICGCTNVINLESLGTCAQLATLYITGCTGITDTALLRLAATSGSNIIVNARGSSITAEAKAQLESSQRISLFAW